MEGTGRIDAVLKWLEVAAERSDVVADKADELRQKLFAEAEAKEADNGVPVGWYTKVSGQVGRIEANLKRIEAMIDSF
jgi:hypothetical protein